MFSRQARANQRDQKDRQHHDAHEYDQNDNGYFHLLSPISRAARASNASPFTATLRSFGVSFFMSARTRPASSTEVAAMAPAPRTVSLSSRCRLSLSTGVLERYPSFSSREMVADKVEAATPRCFASALGLVPTSRSRCTSTEPSCEERRQSVELARMCRL